MSIVVVTNWEKSLNHLKAKDVENCYLFQTNPLLSPRDTVLAADHIRRLDRKLMPPGAPLVLVFKSTFDNEAYKYLYEILDIMVSAGLDLVGTFENKTGGPIFVGYKRGGLLRIELPDLIRLFNPELEKARKRKTKNRRIMLVTILVILVAILYYYYFTFTNVSEQAETEITTKIPSITFVQ